MDQFGFYNQNYLYANVPSSRVYINPNFNRIDAHEHVFVASNSNIVYLNPNFTNIVNLHNTMTVNSEDGRQNIHVNPNFMRAKNLTQDIAPSRNSATSILCNNDMPVPSTSKSTIACRNQLYEKTKCDNMQLNSPISMSRYSLVRKKDNKPLNALKKVEVTNTIKVNKYKTVSLNSVKNTLATEKPNEKNTEPKCHPTKILKTKSKLKVNIKPVLINGQPISRFKFVKRNSTSKINVSELKCNTIQRTSSINKNLKTNLRQTKRIVKLSLKKNNIPCPLYKRFGKCLRMIRGQCDFLHDKKHVSICHKFMKGICHDEKCLLSHDLTDKKMPTCYFYLQGICTKEGCPYLHVKLNENTKTCQDFLKGYCEKGDKCLLRHVNIPSKHTFKTTTRKIISYAQSNKRVSILKATKSIHKTLGNNVNTSPAHASDDAKEQRYFKDSTSNSNSAEQCDLIKPTRCKLGTLPSFIQL